MSEIKIDDIRNEIKAHIVRSGWMLTNIVNEMIKTARRVSRPQRKISPISWLGEPLSTQR